jgi:MYXO-CTERM domain-containing protein
MKMLWNSIPGLLVWAVLSSPAHAHIKLLKPAPWINEDELGGPQKGGPCGPGGPDDVQPMPLSMSMSEFKAGETITVEFEETIYHPGWFRIAVDKDPANFEEIQFPNTTDCNYDMDTVPTEPHGNVLVDGLAKATSLTGANRTFSEMVKLPDEPCEKCTLQVIQVMADAIHSPPGCVYYHCAEIKILPADGAAAAGSGAAGSGGAAGAAGGGSPSAGSAGAAGAGTAIAGAGGTPAAGGTAGVGSKAGAAAPAPAAPSTGTGAAGKPAATTGTGTATAGTTGSTTSPSTTTGDTGATAPSGGCSVASGSADNGAAWALLLSALGLFVASRRRR